MDAVLAGALRIVEFVLAFGVLVFLHEFGHYIVSKVFGIEVEEFGFGFPPRLVKLFQYKETEFTLNWIPFGAFVRPKGENDPNVPGGLAAASPWARLAVLFGGPLMNLLTGLILFSIVFTASGAPIFNKVQIAQVVAGSPAEKAGLQPNDIVLQVNGTPVENSTELKALIDQNRGKQVTMTVERDGKTLDLQATPRVKTGPNEGALGIAMGTATRKVNWIQSLPEAAGMVVEQGRQLIMLPVMLIRGQVSPEEGRMVGPVGIYSLFSAAREADQDQASQPPTQRPPEPPLGYNTLMLLAIISVALGYTNLLPIPALDGGRILFVLPEILLRRRVPAQYENLIHLIGFAALILLMIYITTQDILHPLITR